MFKTLVNVFRVPELRNKVLFTLFMLAVYRIGFHIPIPGVDQDAFAKTMYKERQQPGRRRKVCRQPNCSIRLALLRWKPVAKHDLRPGRDALYLVVNYFPAFGNGRTFAGKASEGKGQSRPAERSRNGRDTLHSPLPSCASCRPGFWLSYMHKISPTPDPEAVYAMVTHIVIQDWLLDRWASLRVSPPVPSS